MHNMYSVYYAHYVYCVICTLCILCQPPVLAKQVSTIIYNIFPQITSLAAYFKISCLIRSKNALLYMMSDDPVTNSWPGINHLACHTFPALRKCLVNILLDKTTTPPPCPATRSCLGFCVNLAIIWFMLHMAGI